MPTLMGSDHQHADTPAGRWVVLVVDDEADIRDTLREILEHAGYAVDTAAGGLDGLSRVAARAYHAIVSDVRMPGMDGMEFYRRLIRADAALARRFILVTGDDLGGMVQQFLADTGVPCIEKPFAPADVRSAVAARLDRQQ